MPYFAPPSLRAPTSSSGVAFGSVTILLYLTFVRVNVSIGSPTIRLMGILLASMLGILLLHEPFTWRYLFGLILTVAGVETLKNYFIIPFFEFLLFLGDFVECCFIWQS